MFSFLTGRKEAAPAQSRKPNESTTTPGDPQSGVPSQKIEDGMNYNPEEDLAPSELSSSAYDSSYNMESPKEVNDEPTPQMHNMLHKTPHSGPAGPSARVAANGDLVHAISYVTEAPEHGYGAGYEDDLSTLGDESIIRRGRQNQQKQQELKAKQLEHQQKIKQKQQQQKFDKTKIDKAHTRSTEQISPSSAGDLSFSFTNVLDMNEKMKDATHLGHEITDDGRSDKVKGEDMLDKIIGGKRKKRDSSSEDKSDAPFFERNKWAIIKFMIFLSLFLLMVATAVLVVSLLHMKGTVKSSSTDASIVSDGGVAANYASATNEMTSIFPVEEAPVPVPTSAKPPGYTSPPSEPATLDDLVETATPTDSWKTDKPLTSAPTATVAKETSAPMDTVVVVEPNATEAPSSSESEVIEIEIVNSIGDVVDDIVTAEQGKIGTDLRFVIANLSPSSLPFLTDPKSAQYKAFDWVTKDPSYWSMDISTIVQRWALAVLYYSTGGPNWKRELLPTTYAEGKSPWLSYSDECLWESSNMDTQGRICDSDKNYFAIHLRSVGLTGTLPAELSLLSDHMRMIFLNGNEVTGSLPTELGQLTALEKLNLQYNQLTGSLPSEMGMLGVLSLAAMGNNQFTGTIPPELGSWGSVKTIGLEQNRLTGTLPSEMSKMYYVEKLSIERNFLSGTIPYDFNYMYQLTSLSMQANDFTGDMQWGLCPGCYSVTELKADCEEVKCDCCTSCFTDPNPVTSSFNANSTTSTSTSTSTIPVSNGPPEGFLRGGLWPESP